MEHNDPDSRTFSAFICSFSTFAITTAIFKEVTAIRETLLLLKLSIDLCVCVSV